MQRSSFPSSRQQRLTLYAYCLMSALLAAYCLIRVFTVGPTFDEVMTIEGFVPASVTDILRYSSPDANHHLLNTLLVKLSFAVFGESIAAARLPNLLFCLVFLYFCVRFCHERIGGAAGLLAFVLLTCNPFLLDFFSLARGYGMAMACEVTALYHAACFVQQKRSRDAGAVFCWSVLAVAANFSLLLFALSCCGWVLVYAVLLLPRRPAVRVGIAAAVALAVGLLITVMPLKKLLEAGALYYGGNNGFFADTILSLAKYSLYRPDADGGVRTAATVAVSLLLMTVLSLWWHRGFRSLKMLLLLLLGTMVAGTLLQHYLLGILYPIDRGALALYPPACMLFALSVKDVPSGRWRTALAVVFAVPVLANGMMRANGFKTALWFFDGRSADALRYIETAAGAQQRTLVVDFSWPFSKSVRWAMATGRFPHLRLAGRTGSMETVNPEADVYILLNHDLDPVGPDHHITPQAGLPPHRVVKTYPEEFVEILELQR